MMKKRIVSIALALVMLLSMTTAVFATDWETPIDVVRVASVGDDYYATLEDAFTQQVEAGAEYVSLSDDLTVTDLVLPENGVLNLNGYTLTADSFDSIAPGAQIIDTAGGEGALVVNGECNFNESNSQLPVKDANGAYRLFAVSVRSVAVTGGTKYWFQVKFENFDAVYALIQAGSDLDIKLNLNIDGVEAEAVAESSFVTKWADTYNTNSGIYITAQLVDAEIGTTVVANPGVGANGVDIKGAEL